MSTAPFTGKVLFDYVAVEDTELTVHKDEFVTVKEASDSGWCLVSNSSGHDGWIPFEYIESGLTTQPVSETVPSATSAPVVVESLSSEISSLSMQESQPPATQPDPHAPLCNGCGEPVTGALVQAKTFSYHPACFKCQGCQVALSDRPFFEKDGAFYCEDDYSSLFNPRCAGCDEVIRSAYINALGRAWHPEHFRCVVCEQPIQDSQFRKLNDQPYCLADYLAQVATPCAACGEPIMDTVFEALDRKYHADCFVCAATGHSIAAGTPVFLHQEKVYCEEHFVESTAVRCAGCSQPITGQFIKVLEKPFHPGCWKCSACQCELTGSTAVLRGDKFFCRPCAASTPVVPPATASPAPAAAAPAPARVSAPVAVPSAASAAHQLPVPRPTPVPIPTPTPAPVPVPVMAVSEPEPEPPASAPVPSSFLDPVGNKFPLSALTRTASALPVGVDSTRREAYLTEEEFQATFKMSMDQFNALPEWKRKQLKQTLKLF